MVKIFQNILFFSTNADWLYSRLETVSIPNTKCIIAASVLTVFYVNVVILTTLTFLFGTEILLNT